LNNVQLLQQDLNLQKQNSQAVLQDSPYADVQLSMAEASAEAADEDLLFDTDVASEIPDSKSEDYDTLKYLEKQLTDAVHAQAIVVSTATDKLLQAEVLDSASDDKVALERDDLEDAKLREAQAKGASDLLAIALLAKKAERDMLENATTEANNTLQSVKPKYLQAEAAYQLALGPIPVIQQNADDAQSEYEEAQDALDAAEYTQDVADAAVNNQTMRLQREVKKLNDQNEKLRDVQADLDRPLPPSQ
jgi:hypothetical protein